MKIGVYLQSLENAQPLHIDEWLPKDGARNDIIAVTLLHSTYKASTQVVNKRRRQDRGKAYEAEVPGGHSPAMMKEENIWSWHDDDSNRLWSDIETLNDGPQALVDAHQTRQKSIKQLSCPSHVHDSLRGLQRASEKYIKLLEHQPKCINAWYGLAIAQRALGEYLASLRALDFCFKLKVNGSLDEDLFPGAAWNARGRTLLRCDRPLQALIAFRRAFHQDPNSKLFAANLATLSDALAAKAETSAERTYLSNFRFHNTKNVIHLADESERNQNICESNDQLIGITSTARRMAEENRQARHRHELQLYDEEHTELLRKLKLDDSQVEIRQTLHETGQEIKQGAEHLSRSLSAHLSEQFQLVSTTRCGHTRLFVYTRKKLKCSIHTVSCAAGDGLMPSAGAAAAALRFPDASTFCFVACDLAANAEILEKCKSAKHEQMLRNHLLCSILSRLRLADEMRSISEQFDHVFLCGNLGYSSQEKMLDEMNSGRVLWGWQVAEINDNNLAAQDKNDNESTISLCTDPSMAKNNIYHSSLSRNYLFGRDISWPLRIAWRSLSFQLLKSSKNCLEVAVSNPNNILRLKNLNEKKRQMPKLLITNLRCSCIPPDLIPAQGSVYLLFGIEPSELLWTSSSHKLRSQLTACFTDAFPYETLSAASWEKEEFALRLRCAENEGAVLVISLWAHGQTQIDSLLGVARISLTKQAFNFQYTLTLDSRAVASISGVIEFLPPWHFGYQHARRSGAGRSLSLSKQLIQNLAKPYRHDETSRNWGADDDTQLSKRTKTFSRDNSSLDEESIPKYNSEDYAWSRLAASSTNLASGGLFWRRTWTQLDLGWKPTDTVEELVSETSNTEAQFAPSWKSRLFGMVRSRSSLDSTSHSGNDIAADNKFRKSHLDNKRDNSHIMSKQPRPPPLTAKDYSYEEQRYFYYYAYSSPPTFLLS